MKNPERNLYWVIGAGVLRPLLNMISQKEWQGAEKIPPSGPALFVANHSSYLDGLFLAHLLYNQNRPPRFLAKAELFRTPLVGKILRGADQIAVERNTDRARDAVGAAITKLNKGCVVGIFPEGTVSRDPNHLPQKPKTGAVRIAAAAGVPIYPVAIWGGQKIILPYQRKIRPFGRKKVYLRVGDPFYLPFLNGKAGANQSPDELNLTATELKEYAEIIMSKITAELKVILEIEGVAGLIE